MGRKMILSADMARNERNGSGGSRMGPRLLESRWPGRMAVILPLAVSLLCIMGTSAFWLREYRQMTFRQISGVCETIAAQSPELEGQVLDALKQYRDKREEGAQGSGLFLEQYGHTEADLSEDIGQKSLLFAALSCLAVSCAFFLSARYLSRKTRSRIDGLMRYLEQVNAGASGTLLQTQEDLFCGLQDEIYKTVTVLNRTREMALRSKEELAQNLANIAHQLKTPITAASLSLRLLVRTGSAQAAQRIERQLSRLSRLEGALLTLSRIDAGVLELAHEPVDVYTVLNLAAENLTDLLSREEIGVDIPDRGCVEMTGDMEWTMEALMNLMKNCMEHSPRGGVIHCDYSENPLYVQIRIWDEGPGFAAEDLPRLFERFYRGKDAKQEGIGIGLSLSRSILEMQNGHLSAGNLEQGGACFEIRAYRH